eukprot:4459219-Amphidinium_carterae.1
MHSTQLDGHLGTKLKAKQLCRSGLEPLRQDPVISHLLLEGTGSQVRRSRSARRADFCNALQSVAGHKC